MLGIGVITYNRAGIIENTLRHLIAYTQEPFFLIVGDDGSTDGTVDVVQSIGVQVITGANRGVCANKNRALFVLQELWACDPIILIEDDTFPFAANWERPWIAAAFKYGHVGLAGEWFSEKFTSGAGTPEDPVVASVISGQCTAFSREALAFVGYLDSRFRGYGVGHVEHTKRFLKAGYGGRHEGGQFEYYLLKSDLIVTYPPSHGSNKDVQRNQELAQQFASDGLHRWIWREDCDRLVIRDETRALKRPEVHPGNGFNFDEGMYRKRHLDVANALSSGKLRTGLEHYIRFGRLEGRILS